MTRTGSRESTDVLSKNFIWSFITLLIWAFFGRSASIFLQNCLGPSEKSAGCALLTLRTWHRTAIRFLVSRVKNTFLLEYQQRQTQSLSAIKVFFHLLLCTKDHSVHISLKASLYKLCIGVKKPYFLFAYFSVCLRIRYLCSSFGGMQLLSNQQKSVKVLHIQLRSKVLHEVDTTNSSWPKTMFVICLNRLADSQLPTVFYPLFTLYISYLNLDVLWTHIPLQRKLSIQILHPSDDITGAYQVAERLHLFNTHSKFAFEEPLYDPS